MQYRVTKLDYTPKQMAESDTYRFLIQLEMDEEIGHMCLCFNYDMRTGKLIGNP